MEHKTLAENISQAIADFDAIKSAIIEKGVPIPAATPTRDYGNKIRAIQGTGGDENIEKIVMECSDLRFSTFQQRRYHEDDYTAEAVAKTVALANSIMGRA